MAGPVVKEPVMASDEKPVWSALLWGNFARLSRIVNVPSIRHVRSDACDNSNHQCHKPMSHIFNPIHAIGLMRAWRILTVLWWRVAEVVRDLRN